jgi:hypothetical protein
MVWRLTKHGRISEEEEEETDLKATRLIAYSFFILGAYVLYEAVKKLYFHEIPSPTLLGITISIIPIIVMPILI